MNKIIYIGVALILVGLVSFALIFNGSPSVRYVNTSISASVYACYSGEGDFSCPPEVNVTIIEVADFQCPYCGSDEPIVWNILKEYAGKVRLGFINFPLPEHQYSEKAAEAFECAVDQGKEWRLYSLMFQNQGDLSVSSLKSYAVQAGLNSTLFNNCLDSGVKAGVVQQQFNEGVRLGVRGTPTFFINNQMLEGYQSQSSFENIINRVLNQASNSS